MLLWKRAGIESAVLTQAAECVWVTRRASKEGREREDTHISVLCRDACVRPSLLCTHTGRYEACRITSGLPMGHELKETTMTRYVLRPY